MAIDFDDLNNFRRRSPMPLLDKLIHDEEPKVRLLAYDALRAEEEQQKSNQQGKRRVLFVQDNYDDEIENSEFDFDV